MKTEREISEWLHQQKWISAFVRNLKEVGKMTKREATKILLGQYHLNTIAAAFKWDKTRQGHEYWNNKHKEFKDWYYGTQS